MAQRGGGASTHQTSLLFVVIDAQEHAQRVRASHSARWVQDKARLHAKHREHVAGFGLARFEGVNFCHPELNQLPFQPGGR